MSRNSTHINCNQTVGTANQGIWANDCDPCATTPFSIPNIQVWHRYNHSINGHTSASDILTNVPDGTKVYQWDDQIGTNHAVQSLDADKPTWFTTDSSLGFNGNHHMDLTTGTSYVGGNEFTILLSYVQLLGTTVANEILWQNTAGTTYLKYVDDTTIEFSENGTLHTITGPTIQLINYTNFVIRRNAADVCQIFITGVAWGSTFTVPGTVGFDEFGFTTDGYVASHMQFDRALSDKEIWCLDCYNSNQDDVAEPVVCRIDTDILDCYGDTDGTLTAVLTGATLPITYSWTGPGGYTASTATITGLSAGQYICTMVDSAGPANVAVCTGDVTQPAAALVCTFVGVNPTWGPGNNYIIDGSISGTVTGGWGAGIVLTWTYDDGAGGGPVTITPTDPYNFTGAAGTYVLTAEDANGCTCTSTINLVDPSLPFLDIECCYSPVVCHDDPQGWAVLMDPTSVYNVTIVASDGTNTHTITLPSAPATTTISNANYPDCCDGLDIGDFHEGGIVFWLDGNGGGLVCDVEDLPMNVPSGTTDGQAEWGCASGHFDYSSGSGVWVPTPSMTTGTAIGTGAANTAAIIAGGCGTQSNSTGASLAAVECDASTKNSYTDWFLPSRDELNEIYSHKALINAAASANGGSDFVAGGYLYLWSSSEHETDSWGTANPDWAYWQKFADGSIYPHGKSTMTHVRAVRAFAAGGGTSGPCTGAWYYADTAVHPLLPGVAITIQVDDATRTQTCSATPNTNPALLEISNHFTNATECDPPATNASGSYFAQGGVGPYTYALTNAAGTVVTTGTNYSGLPVDTYTITVTDANGCTATETFIVSCPVSVEFGCSSTNVSCQYDPGLTNLTTPCDGTISYTMLPTTVAGYTFQLYVYYGGTTTIVMPATVFAGTVNYTSPQTLINLCPGDYDYKLWATETASGTSSVIDTGMCKVDVPAIVGATTVQTTTACAGGSDGTITLTAYGGTGTYTYAWTIPGGSTGVIPGGQASNQNLTGLVVGLYHWVVTDSNGCWAEGDQWVESGNNNWYISPSAQALSCNGSTTDISLWVSGGVAPLTYTWSTSNGNLGGQTAIAEPLGVTAGTYDISVEDANGCIETGSVTILPGSTITNSISSTNVACKGGRTGEAWADTQASGATYLWTTGSAGSGGTPVAFGIGSAFPNINALPAGTYYLEYTEQSGCVWTGSVVITEPGSGMVASSTTVDANECTGCCGEIDLSVSGGSSPYSYDWTGPGGPYYTEDIDPACAGNYVCTITDDAGCQITHNVTVNNISTSITVNVTYNATSGLFDAAASGGSPAYTYAWYLNGNQFSFLANPQAAGNGYYCCTVTDQDGCESSDCLDFTGDPRNNDYYKCENNSCYSTTSTSGTYFIDLQNCLDSGCEVIRTQKYRCGESGCYSHPGGTWTDLAACNASCNITQHDAKEWECKILCESGGEQYKAGGDRKNDKEESGGAGGYCREKQAGSILTGYSTRQLCLANCPWCKDSTTQDPENYGE